MKAWALVIVLVACGSNTSSPDSGTPDGSTNNDAAQSSDSPQTNDASSTSDAPTSCATCWKPTPQTRWQYQLQGGVDTSVSSAPFGGGNPVTPDAFDIDLYAADGTTPDSAGTAALHKLGRKAVCYVDAGTYENFRPDASDYTTFDGACGGCLLGQTNGWPGEQWMNVNDDKGQRTFILAELEKRVAKCVAASFDAVEFDNVDGYANTTGFTITSATQELFNVAIANLAHQHGLAVGLKNDLDQVADLEPYFDFAVNEQCFEFSECDMLAPFQTAQKPVFNVEYNLQPSQFCAQANTKSIVSIQKDLALDPTPWVPCH